MNIASGASRRSALILLGTLLCAAWAYVTLPGHLAAEDKKPAAAANAAKADANAKKPAANAAKPDADAKKPAADDENPPPASDEAKKTVETESTLWWVIKWSGPIGLVLLLLSIYFVSTVARLFWEMRVEVAAPPETVAQCESLLERRDFKGIYALVKEDDSFFGRLLTTGIADLPNGLAEARDSMERMGETITAEMEKKISMLAVLGTLGPMIGLLGTLKGMIGAFAQIGTAVGASIDTSAVANRLSESLLITFEGVSLSVPAIYFYALFRNRVIHISTSVALSADQFLRHFSHAGRAKASAAVPPPKPTT
ncbi:MAG: MotA/TolQ/ExbB proton channel family protein [Thermoguttaceae bacterium]|jgi:biopolymer transport protein ExbB